MALTWLPAARRGAAGRRPGASNLLASFIHAPAEARAAVALQRLVVALVVAHGYVVSWVRLRIEPLMFAWCQAL